MEDNTMTRLQGQLDLVDSKIFTTPITVVGAGAIGSFTVLTLCKMGFVDVTVYDPDTIEDHNIAVQFYPESGIGSSKTAILQGMITQFTGVGIQTYTMEWTSNMRIAGLVISAVDNMATRTELFRACVRNKVTGFIDGRMGGQQAEVYAVRIGNRDEQARYRDRLFPDAQASPLRCTQKAVMYNVLWIASTIANTARLMLEDKPYQAEVLYDFENSTQYNIAHATA